MKGYIYGCRNLEVSSWAGTGPKLHQNWEGEARGEEIVVTKLVQAVLVVGPSLPVPLLVFDPPYSSSNRHQSLIVIPGLPSITYFGPRPPTFGSTLFPELSGFNRKVLLHWDTTSPERPSSLNSASPLPLKEQEDRGSSTW